MSTGDQPVDLAGASVSSHACLIYRSADERWARLAEFVRGGLERGERVLCLTDPGREDAFHSRLEEAGLDGTEAADSGQLLIRPARDFYLTDGGFSPEESLRRLRSAIRRAERDGFAGFRVTGGTGRAAASSQGTKRLLQYERRAGPLLERHGCSGLCQYAAATVDDTTLDELRRVHTRVLEGGPDASARRRPPETRPDRAAGPADARRFHALIENISDVVTRISRDGTIIYESPSVQRVLGYSPEERIGEDVFGYVHPADREEARARFRDVLDRPGTVESVRVRVRHAEGRWRLLEVVGARPDVPGGDASEVIVTSRDVTDRAERSERLARNRRRLRKLAHRLLRVQEEQRRRFSRELHDSLGQTLTSLRLRLESGDPPEARDRRDELLALVDEALDEVRELSASVRPAVVEEGSLVPTLRGFVRREGREAGLDVRFRAREPAGSPGDRVATACVGITREAVTNVIRHADAERLTVVLRPAGEALELVVEDDGRGIRRDGGSGFGAEQGLGLTSMLERALSVGGTLDIDSEPGRGTSVRARLPFQDS